MRDEELENSRLPTKEGKGCTRLRVLLCQPNNARKIVAHVVRKPRYCLTVMR